MGIPVSSLWTGASKSGFRSKVLLPLSRWDQGIPSDATTYNKSKVESLLGNHLCLEVNTSSALFFIRRLLEKSCLQKHILLSFFMIYNRILCNTRPIL